jgi:hypothetical protein
VPTGGIDPLAEVAVSIQETDTNHGHAQVAGRLEMIAREHAEST